MITHAHIMNLPCAPQPETVAMFGSDPMLAYKLGHRDARHAVADLIVAEENACPPAGSLQPFHRLPMGARMTYPDDDTVWVVLSTAGCGTVAKWEGNQLDFVGQIVCSAADSEADAKSLTVRLLD